MKTRLLIALTVALLIVCFALSACGEDKKDANSETESKNPTEITAASGETTVVLETTSDGGTVEQDSEGNKITIDKDGSVTSVEDRNGDPIDVADYLTTHKQAQQEGNTKSDSGKSNIGQEASEDKTPSDVQDDEIEDDIPVIIATLPNEDELVDLPEL